jgi:hypothetical protein
MGSLVRFPQERVDYFKSVDCGQDAAILVLPVVRFERQDGSVGGGRRGGRSDSRETVNVDPVRETPDATDCN